MLAPPVPKEAEEPEKVSLPHGRVSHRELEAAVGADVLVPQLLDEAVFVEEVIPVAGRGHEGFVLFQVGETNVAPDLLGGHPVVDVRPVFLLLEPKLSDEFWTRRSAQVQPLHHLGDVEANVLLLLNPDLLPDEVLQPEPSVPHFPGFLSLQQKPESHQNQLRRYLNWFYRNLPGAGIINVHDFQINYLYY